MHTPYFPSLRCRLAALGRRTAKIVHQATLAQLQQNLRDLLPAPLLASEDEGTNSRDRSFSLRLTFECFIWQMLKPNTSCREVVRQVQALFRLRGRGLVDEGDSGYVQARLRLPKERLEKALVTTAQTADGRAGSGGQLKAARSKWPTVPPRHTVGAAAGTALPSGRVLAPMVSAEHHLLLAR